MGFRDWLRPYPKDIPEPPDRNDNLVRILREQRDDGMVLAREQIGRANRAERERDHWKARAEHLGSALRCSRANFIASGSPPKSPKQTCATPIPDPGAQRESVADAAEGDETAVWVPQVGERVTGMGCGTGITCELPRTGLYMGTGESFKGRATAWLHDGEASPVLAYADTLRPAPSEREGDKQ